MRRGEVIILKSISLFLLAGLAEIGGGYLIWLWLRGGRPILVGAIGGIILMLYGVIPTLQPFPNFGRIYAAYGGVFIILSLLWGWGIDKKTPDTYDLLGSLICIIGVTVIMYAPRA